MSIADQIAPQLPYLRRYARSLTGNQTSGDNYVAAVLETLISEPDSFDSNLEPKVALYRVFTKVWNSLAVNQTTEDAPEPADKSITDRRLETITPMPRQAFLLVSVEGFTPAETAQVLDVPSSHVTELLQIAGTEISQQLSADVLIIEDEPLIAMDLEALVSDIGHRVIGVARTHTEAVAEVKKHEPTLVLADIHLADGSSGLEAVNEILKSISVPVIFITAYPERLLTGEKPEPVFLVSKPFEPSVVKALISQSLFFGLKSGKNGQAAA